MCLILNWGPVANLPCAVTKLEPGEQEKVLCCAVSLAHCLVYFIFWNCNYIISPFPFLPWLPPCTVPSLSQMADLFFFFNYCWCVCVWERELYKYNLLSPVRLVVCVFSGLTVWYQIVSWCAPPGGIPVLSIFLSFALRPHELPFHVSISIGFIPSQFLFRQAVLVRLHGDGFLTFLRDTLSQQISCPSDP